MVQSSLIKIKKNFKIKYRLYKIFKNLILLNFKINKNKKYLLKYKF